MIRNKGQIRDRIAPYLFISPFLISFIAFFAFPSVYSLILSFYRYKGYGSATFVGVNNYIALLTYGQFWQTVKNTGFYYLIHLIPIMVIPFLLAIAMNSKLSILKKFTKSTIFLPQIVSVVAAALVFRIMMSTRYGMINQMLGTQIPFLEDEKLMKWSVTIMFIWRGIGWFLVVFLAGLTTIDAELSDAVAIDGANKRQEIFFITIPMMKPIFLFCFVMDTITSLKLFVEPNLLLASSSSVGAPQMGETIMNQLTLNINNGSFGMASAVGWILFLIILVVSFVQFRFFEERG